MQDAIPSSAHENPDIEPGNSEKDTPIPLPLPIEARPAALKNSGTRVDTGSPGEADYGLSTRILVHCHRTSTFPSVNDERRERQTHSSVLGSASGACLLEPITVLETCWEGYRDSLRSLSWGSCEQLFVRTFTQDIFIMGDTTSHKMARTTQLPESLGYSIPSLVAWWCVWVGPVYQTAICAPDTSTGLMGHFTIFPITFAVEQTALDLLLEQEATAGARRPDCLVVSQDAPCCLSKTL